MKPFRAIIAAIATLFSSFDAFAAYQFSDYGFARNPARVDNSLRVEMTGRTALRSYRFLRVVGGINFETAVDLSGISFSLIYDSSAPDGRRARIEVDEIEYFLPLYDWQLAPIAAYADSDYTAVASIFGDGPDPDNFYYIDYHPALEDTHLGMRLLQADILLMDPFTFSEAPTDGGEKVYMPGELPEADEPAREQAALELSAITSSDPYQAWVLTDTEITPVLELDSGVARVELQPYYFFWNSGDSQELVTYRARAAPMIDELESLRERALPLIQEHEAAYSAYMAAPANSSQETEALRQLELLKTELEPIETKFTRLEAELVALGEPPDPVVEEVPTLTRRLRDAQEILDQAAPFVTEAVRKTAAYAALFRGAKRANPEEWQRFREEVRTSVRLPPAETPNEFRRGTQG